ncbi:MAG: discoidin domain-containing protein [Eubacteriales bacterium]
MQKQWIKSALSLMLLISITGCQSAPAKEGGTTVNSTTSGAGTSQNPISTTQNPILTTPDPVSDALYEAFLNPDEHLKTKPLFFWNVPLDEMTTDTVREIVRKSYEESGYNGFGILPYWLDGYMSDQYFELYEAALDEGSKYGMQFSLYDEDGFPSYTAGGLFAETYPDLTARRLDMAEGEGKAGQTVFVKLPQGVLLSAVAMNTVTKERIDISDYAHIVDLPDFDPDDQPIGALASSTYTITQGYEVDKAFDGKQSTRWNAISGSGSRSWIQINYGKPTTFDKISVYEDKNPEVQRVSSFEIQYWDGSQWQVCASGEKITDAGVTLTFDPVTSQFVRIYFKRIVGDSASISEFEVYNGDEKLDPPASNPSDTYAPGYYASSIYGSDYDADKAFDGDPETRWNSANGASVNQWLMISYGREVSVDSVYLSEALGRISKFEIQYWDGSQWKACASGTTIGTKKELSFDPVKTTMLRLVMSTPGGDLPSIYEFASYFGGKKLIPESNEDVSSYKGSYIEYTIPKDAADGTWKIMGFLSVVDGSEGMDYLSEEAVAGYIQITHEAYYQRFKKYFDNGTITSSFYDEPSFYPAGGLTAYGVEGARMWTDDFNEFFGSVYGGEDPSLLYPALFYDIGEDTAEARDKLLGVRSEMFAKNYIGQVDQWCTDHGIKLMGHMLMEEQVNPVSIEGDLMLCFKYQTIPGVDLIGSYGFSQEAYKIISSSAQNWDKQLVMCEAFGAMGPDTPVSTLYKGTIDLYTKGINLIVPHAVWYDNTKNVVYPPELSYRNEKYASELSAYNTYVARLATLLQQSGRHVADIALVYPIDYLESVYLFNGSTNGPADANYMQVGEYLSLTARRDFTYLHPEVLDEKCTVENGVLTLNNEVNTEQFRVVILPGMKSISLSNLEKIYEFWKSGGSVISVGTLPTHGTKAADDARVVEIITEMFGADPARITTSCEKITDQGKAFHVTAPEELDSVLDKALSVWDVKIENAGRQSGGYLSYIHKVVDGRNIYYIGNSSNREVSFTITLRGEYSNLKIWDPATGEQSDVTAVVGNGVTKLNLKLSGVTSLFLVEG